MVQIQFMILFCSVHEYFISPNHKKSAFGASLQLLSSFLMCIMPYKKSLNFFHGLHKWIVYYTYVAIDIV
ncbi:hypothetical protein XELAEV_18020524mg [Xenopus laevis]|uniref:Uncharacterized protein n=1 Tax=Xenopus laevis TaxID=8355 RepID=A0A974D7Z6_XENLA|nr:hypothetical protein XELAEV_18020524mg [Xenopus laevis]